MVRPIQLLYCSTGPAPLLTANNISISRKEPNSQAEQSNEGAAFLPFFGVGRVVLSFIHYQGSKGGRETLNK
jgi:hypothetical protein